jgi:hypothetical protein
MKARLILIGLLAIGFLGAIHMPASAQLLPTNLQITVLDELGNPVEGATLRIYKSEADYQAETNQVGTTIKTDKSGRASFRKMEAIPYYVLAEKGDLNNFGLGVRIEKLEEGKFNRVTIIIN